MRAGHPLAAPTHQLGLALRRGMRAPRSPRRAARAARVSSWRPANGPRPSLRPQWVHGAGAWHSKHCPSSRSHPRTQDLCMEVNSALGLPNADNAYGPWFVEKAEDLPPLTLYGWSWSALDSVCMPLNLGETCMQTCSMGPSRCRRHGMPSPTPAPPPPPDIEPGGSGAAMYTCGVRRGGSVHRAPAVASATATRPPRCGRPHHSADTPSCPRDAATTDNTATDPISFAYTPPPTAIINTNGTAVPSDATITMDSLGSVCVDPPCYNSTWTVSSRGGWRCLEKAAARGCYSQRCRASAGDLDGDVGLVLNPPPPKRAHARSVAAHRTPRLAQCSGRLPTPRSCRLRAPTASTPRQQGLPSRGPQVFVAATSRCQARRNRCSASSRLRS